MHDFLQIFSKLPSYRNDDVKNRQNSVSFYEKSNPENPDHPVYPVCSTILLCSSFDLSILKIIKQGK